MHLESIAIQIPKKEAAQKYKKCLELLKREKDKRIEALKRGYWHAAQGKKLIDIPDAIRQIGLNDEGQPKLAIARADWGRVFLHSTSDGTGIYTQWGDTPTGGIYTEVRVPKLLPKDNPWYWKALSAPVPLVSPEVRLNLKGRLQNYWILWEVEKWEEVPVDPILLKRITGRLFAVIDTWELSELERMVLREFTF